MEDCLYKHEIEALFYDDPGYPSLLRELPDKPFVLYCKGNSALLATFMLSCVGTRAMTTYGKRVVHYLLGDLVAHGITLVSGMALGIDAQVHQLSFEKGMPTVGVLGGGLDRYEPTTNAWIGRQIVEKGCLVSEYPPGVRPQRYTFLHRNRIIAGLSRATIVVEGKELSGSLVTAKYALAYGREVGVVPGEIFAPNAQGPLLILRDGAWPLVTPNDVCAMLRLEPISGKTINYRNEVHSFLAKGAHTVDALQSALKLSTVQVRQQLVALELDGLVGVSSIGEYYLL